MWGTGRPGASMNRDAAPGMMPRQRVVPSADASWRSCMPRQIPSTGWVSVGISDSSRWPRSRAMASAAAPTPGRMTWLAARMRSASADTSEGEPRRSSANCSDAMFAPPEATMTTLMRSLARGSQPRLVSQDTFGAGHLAALASNRLLEAPADALEARLDHVVTVLAAHADVDRCAQRLGQRAEKMRNELGRQFADAFALEASLPDEIRPTREIDRDLCLGLVHGQQETVPRDALFVAQRLAQRRAQRQRAIFHGVMLIDVKIALAVELQGESAVLRDLFQHVVEESQSRGNAARPLARQIEAPGDVGFLGSSLDPGAARGAKNSAGNRGPAVLDGTVDEDPQSRDTEFVGELEVGVAVADHEAACGVEGMNSNVFLDHAELRLAAPAVLMLVVRTHEYGVEVDSLAGEQVEHEPMRLFEVLGRQTRRAEPILVGHHDELQARPPKLDQRGYHPGHQFDLVEPVHFLVRRLLDQCAVAIHEHDSLSTHAASRLDINASFWARVPTVILNESGSAGFERMSRTMVPPAMLERRNASGSLLSISRKFASLGQTLVTPGMESSRSRKFPRSSRSACTRACVAATSPGSRAVSAASMVG